MKDALVVIGIIYLIFLISYLLVEGRKGFSIAAKSLAFWIMGMLGLVVIGGLIWFVLAYVLHSCAY